MDEFEIPAKQDPATEKKYKLMLSLWLSFCIVGFIWFVTKVLKGRQRIRYNFTSIEEQLKKMQAMMEEREKELENKSITEGENDQEEGIEEIEAEKPTEGKEEQDNEENEENLEENSKLSNGEVNFYDSEDDEKESEVNTSRKRIKINNLNVSEEGNVMDKDNLELIRDTIEDIINEGVKEVGEEISKKHN